MITRSATIQTRRCGEVLARFTAYSNIAVPANLWMEVYFSWDAVIGADSYQLEVGVTPGGSEYTVVNTGSALEYTINFPPGTYYSRVRAVVGGVPQTPTADYIFYV